MALKLKGYRGVDRKVATEQGVDFKYPLVDAAYEEKLGTVYIRARMINQKLNPQFAKAYAAYNEWQEQRKDAFQSVEDEEASKRFIEMLYDSAVISWSTDAEHEGGGRIESTRENFVALMLEEAAQKALLLFFRQASDPKYFRAVDTEEAAKNSVTSSADSSAGGRTETQQAAATS